MKVIKRDGRIQKFDLQKIKTSIMRASDDIKQPMNALDVNAIANKIKEQLISLAKEKIKSIEIHNVTIDKLNKNGFKQVAKSYDIKI